jgi:hypothetical protein
MFPTQWLFPPGLIVATPGALSALRESGEGSGPFIERHLSGDWGDLGADDKNANTRALTQGSRLMSSYRTARGTKLWVITEADRSSTCLLLPEEY